MKTGFVHICFIIDESGSMSGSENDVNSGVKKVIDEQKAVKDGFCAVSLYTFESIVHKHYVGKDVSEVPEFNLYTKGCTAMNDGIGQAIDEIGQWLSDMPEEERPEKNLIVIITDGEENMSRKYSFSQIKEMIKHQEEKYNWTFMYLGTDITDTTQADTLGIRNQGYTSKANIGAVYDTINTINTNFRSSTADHITKNLCYAAATMDSLDMMTSDYSAELGITIDNTKVRK